MDRLLAAPLAMSGQNTSAFVLNTDLAPTIADFAGVSTPLPSTGHGVDGQSLYS